MQGSIASLFWKFWVTLLVENFMKKRVLPVRHRTQSLFEFFNGAQSWVFLALPPAPRRGNPSWTTISNPWFTTTNFQARVTCLTSKSCVWHRIESWSDIANWKTDEVDIGKWGIERFSKTQFWEILGFGIDSWFASTLNFVEYSLGQNSGPGALVQET